MNIPGWAVEGKRNSSGVRRWKEQRRNLLSSCLYSLAALWAILIATGFLILGLPLLPLSASRETFGNQTGFLSGGIGGEWDSVQQRDVGGGKPHWLWGSRRRSTANNVQVESPVAGGSRKDHLGRVVQVANVSDDGLANLQGFGSRGRPCASVEEMGLAATGDTREASLRLRRAIRSYFAEHGAQRVRQLPPDLFCARNFVLGKAQDDGFGNNMYRLLTAAGLGLILNRSLIIGEGSSTNAGYLGTSNHPLRLPFGDYVSYSEQAFSMREIKRLWVANDCSGRYNRALSLKVDLFNSPYRSSVLCEDWTEWAGHPILWFKDAEDAVALQFLLKNRHGSVRFSAARVLGDPSRPDSRPNAFGELMRAVVEPQPEVQKAVEWSLQRMDGNPPDIALHLRLRHNPAKSALAAAISCTERILSELPMAAGRRASVVVVSDTPSAVGFMKNSSLARLADIFSFDHEEFLRLPAQKESSLRADIFLPPSKRKADWGPLPRWVAVVDFFLAARAKHAVVSGAHRRVSTTYAQLVASLADAYTLQEQQEAHPAKLYSSFQESLLVQGLASQVGWGHSWRPFGGKLSCPSQPKQCAVTPLLPYAWWDAPWQSPSDRDQRKLRQWGIMVEGDGRVTDDSLQNFCQNKKTNGPSSILLALPKPKS